jgi:replicative superfamily II helicase
LALTERFLADGKQVIVFRTTVAKVVDTARNLRGRLPAVGIDHEINERFSTLDDSESVNDLRLCLASGVGFHDADLTHPNGRSSSRRSDPARPAPWSPRPPWLWA